MLGRPPEVPQSQEAAHIPKSEFTWGIPTRSDVRNAEYHEILRLEELNEKIREQRWPTSTIFLHNHVAGALRFVGEDPLKAEQVYKSGEYRPGLITKLKGKPNFREFLNPQGVLDDSLQALSKYEQALAEARPYIPHLEKEDYTIETTARYSELPEGVKEEKTTLKWYGNGKEKGWRYTFKPWDLVSRELTSLRKDLEKVLETEDDPIKQIQLLWEALDSHGNSPAKRLAGGALRIPLEKTSYQMEHDQKTEAGQLHAFNEQVAAGSDIYVRFDEIYLVQKRGSERILSSPFRNIIDPEEIFTSGGLWVRTGIRDYLREQFMKERRVVFNGIEVAESGLSQVGKGLYEPGLKASQELPQWIVNLIAKPIEVNGKILTPENWIIREREMVNDYRNLSLKDSLRTEPLHPAVKILLFAYKGFQRELTTSGEWLDHLFYSLREEDWKKHHRKI